MLSNARFVLIGLCTIAAVTLLAPRISNAQACPTVPVWQSTGTISASESDTKFAPLDAGASYFAHGPTVYAVWNETGSSPVVHTAGTVRWTWSGSAS